MKQARSDKIMLFVEEFNKIRKEQNRGIDYIAKQAEIPKTTIWSWFYNGAEPAVSKFNAALNALGYELKIIKKETEE
jgi:DNA-binding phage protein